MEKAYAQAIQKLLKEPHADEAKIVKNLVSHLEATGKLKMLPRINRELKTLLARELKPSVEVAHRSEADQALKEAAKAGIHTEHAHINPSLIHGWRARQGSTLVDHSGKRALIDLYRRITA
ncbi:MAG: hypothetical protein AB202_00430 [Parcubacteria bacterium C7867-007]|nr:MAG: hypothetical protein AB202_00430 [Parcubacteria bacterium C7867-007]